MAVKHASEIPFDSVETGKETSRQVLIGPEEGPHFAMRRFIIKPGGSMPVHTNTVEHEQYVLRGRAEITIGDETFHVSPDDIVFIPAGTPHSYRVTGDEPFEFLCVVPHLPAKMEIPGDQ
jgi:quercetin dioxygenase-like cupin family protein